MGAFFVSPWPLRIWAALALFSQTTWAGRIANAISIWIFGPGPSAIGSPPFLLQKGYHCFLFGVLGWLAANAGKSGHRWRTLAWVVGFSALAEMLQLLAPGRHPQISDALINVVSASLAWTVAVRRQATT